MHTIPILRRKCAYVGITGYSHTNNENAFVVVAVAVVIVVVVVWGPPNLLSNGYRGLFPGDKAAGA
jgi:hypothetical protein